MKFKSFTTLYLLGLLFVGLGYISFLPAFEGFDETAHISRVREYAYTLDGLFKKDAFLDKSIVNYSGPLPYSSGTPPFDKGITYPNFFADESRLKDYTHKYASAPFDAPFVPSDQLNWQSQHPPLYYLLLAPVMRSMDGIPFLHQVFVLRFCSYLLALAGVAMGLLAVQRLGREGALVSDQHWGFIAYPVLFPMFFLEFTRVGNDSLCCLLVGAIFYSMSNWLTGNKTTRSLTLVGILIGLGLLTKAFFIPILAATIFFLLLSYLRNGVSLLAIKNASRDAGLVLGPALLIGGAWYLFKFIYFGDLGLGSEANQIKDFNVLQLWGNFSLLPLFRGLVVCVVTFFWAGTWSLVHMPHTLLFFLCLGGLVFGYHAFKALLVLPMNHYTWLASWLLLFFFVSLFFHVLLSQFLSGSGVSGGWYLHILMPITAPALGLAFNKALSQTRKSSYRLIFYYALTFHMLALLALFGVFSGYLIKLMDKSLGYVTNELSFHTFIDLFERLTIVSMPSFSLLAFVGGFLCAVKLFNNLTNTK